MRLEGRSYSEDEIHKNTEINVSTGNDYYKGDEETEKISYEYMKDDKLTGLHISNKEEDFTIISDNMPPLIESNKSDDLIVYKRYENNENNIEGDLLHDIEIIRASNKNDEAVIYGNNNTVINFLDGNDKAIVYSNSLDLSVEKLENVETIEWILTDTDNKIDSATNRGEKHVFDVVAVEEDNNNRIYIDDYTDKNISDIDLEIGYFNELSNDKEQLGQWVDLNVAATPEQIGSNKIVIYTKIQEDEDEENEEWLEIHAQDLRDEGDGLIGLDLNVSWDNNIYEMSEPDLERNNIFEGNQLPLFQSKGVVTKDSERTKIENITSAALPRGNTGIALGNSKDPILQTLFAKIKLINKDKTNNPNIRPEINSFQQQVVKLQHVKI